MIVKQPKTKRERLDRNILLQTTLRPEILPFPIEDEYPIVLEKKSPYSFCLYETQNGKPISHANLYPLELINKETDTKYNVGLIGNVATSPGYQGKGYMKKLLHYLESKAILEGLSALLLWTDLDEFYQKIGYQALGKELRVTLQKLGKTAIAHRKYESGLASTSLLTQDDMNTLLKIRYETTIYAARSPKSFIELLSIPLCELVITRDENKNILAYAVIGKGYDMFRVVHEWGFTTGSAFLECIDFIFRNHQLEDLMIIGPESSQMDLRAIFEGHILHIESHKMVFVKSLIKEKIKTLDWNQAFIWGLDSI